MSYLFAVAAVWLLINVVQTAPERNLTALKTEYAPPFIPEPDGRGTWSLLYSCVFTLVLCVWTAIHPNLPDPGAPEIRKYRFKGLWVVWAIFAPEIRVWTAFKQYRRATSFISELSRLRDEHTLRTRKNSDADPRDLEGQRSADTNRPELVSLQVDSGTVSAQSLR